MSVHFCELCNRVFRDRACFDRGCKKCQEARAQLSIERPKIDKKRPDIPIAEHIEWFE